MLKLTQKHASTTSNRSIVRLLFKWTSTFSYYQVGSNPVVGTARYNVASDVTMETEVARRYEDIGDGTTFGHEKQCGHLSSF